jgi:hypothetical protein
LQKNISVKKNFRQTLKTATKALLSVVVLVAIVGAILLAQGPQALTSSTTSASFTMPVSCHSTGGLPDPNCTPGATNPDVTQANIDSTICVSGYTATIRPPASYTNPLKVQSIHDYGYNDTNVSDYEEDHLIPLEVGGDPTSVLNLWAEPRYGTYAAEDKDAFENYLHAQVCGGSMTLAEAQHEVATDWGRYWVAAGQP